MIRLLTLGPVELSGPPDTSPEQVLAQPKRLAVLAYLAVTGPRGVQPRDTLLAIFWPELEAARARENLRQALSFLRRALGSDVLVSRGSVSVTLSPDHLWCDAGEFERLLDAGDRRGALSLYRGDLLEGFHVSGAAPEFDHWVDQERARLKRRACEAARAMSEEAEEAGDLPDAVRWARREVELDRFDERALRRLLGLMVDADDCWAALAEYDRFERHLEAIYEDAPSAETRTLAAEVRLQWEISRRLEPHPEAATAIGVTSEPPSLADAPSNVSTPEEVDSRASPIVLSAPPGERRHRLAGRYGRIAALITLPVLLALGSFIGGDSSSSISPADGTVAVLPFRVGGADPSLHYLEEGMVDLLAARLNGGITPRAINGRTVLSAWRRAAGDGQGFQQEDAIELAWDLKAERVLLGEVVGSPERLILNAVLHSVPEGRVVARASAQGPADSLSALVDRIAGRLALASAGQSEDRVRSLEGIPLPALEAYLRGVSRYRFAEYATARTHFLRALEVDSTFALAALGLVSTYRFDGAGREPFDAAERALRLRNRLSPRDQVLLDALVGPFDRKPIPLSEQLRRWEQAVEAQPDNGEAWFWLGNTLNVWGPVLGLRGAHERALAAYKRSLELDPDRVVALTHLVGVAASVGDLRTARDGYEQFLRLDANRSEYTFIHGYLESLAEGKSLAGVVQRHLDDPSPFNLAVLLGAGQLRQMDLGDVDSAVATLRREVGARPEEAVAYTYLYYLSLNRGRPSDLRWITDRLQLISPESLDPLRAQVMAALYSDGDPRVGAEAARKLAAATDRSSMRGTPMGEDYLNLCVAEQWKLRHRDTRTAAQAIEWLRASGSTGEEPLTVHQRRGCARFLAILLDLAHGRTATAITALERLSRNPEDGLVGPWAPTHLPNLVLAEAYEAAGQPGRALAALRRRPHHILFGIQYLSTFLIREAHLAEAVGDHQRAIQAYRHYLALRPEPESAVAAEVEAARRRLRHLEGRRTGGSAR